MDAARIDELILEGKNSQEIRKKLKERTQKSFEIKNKGKKVAQEVISTVKLPHPIYIDSASGGTMTDVDGNTYIDTTMGFGPIILGHNHEVIKDALSAQMEKGWLFGLPADQQFELGELLIICRLSCNFPFRQQMHDNLFKNLYHCFYCIHITAYKYLSHGLFNKNIESSAH